MLKEKKGVTLISLVITIVVMIIILGITVFTADDLLRKTDIRKFQTNLYLVEARAKTMLNNYLFDGTDKLGNELDDVNISKFSWEENTSKYIYREWNIEELRKQGIDTSNVAENEKFIIKYDIINEEVDVASTRGIVDGNGEEKYTLSSLEEK